MITNCRVIGLTRLEIKPESKAPEVDILPLGHLSCKLPSVAVSGIMNDS